MLTCTQLQSFFESNDIPLNGDKNMSANEISDLFVKATNLGISFGNFFYYTVVNVEKNGISNRFDSWDVLYTFYCHFMTGFFSGTSPNN